MDWWCLVRPGSFFRVGRVFTHDSGCQGEVIAVSEDGHRCIRWTLPSEFTDMLSFLDVHGTVPLPPYIHNTLEQKDRYQTVFCQATGSVAAPTAGLHFTTELLDSLQARGVRLAHVVLHVGLGTFLPVSGDLDTHVMHAEWASISSETAQMLSEARAAGRRITALGTTAARVLQTSWNLGDHKQYTPFSGETRIFIRSMEQADGFDRLFTNFHQPQSTLLVLVSSFVSDQTIQAVYDYALQNDFRFLSFGDACLFSADPQEFL